MAHAGSCFFSVSDRPPLSPAGPGASPIVVWLRGEHDLSTDGALSLTLARAMAVQGDGLVLDLSEVDFIGASTLGTIVRAREFLRRRSSWLTVRSPSAQARRVIDACDLNDLLEPSLEMAGEASRHALGSWVEVPVVQRSYGEAASSALVPERVPAVVGRSSALRAQVVTTDAVAETA